MINFFAKFLPKQKYIIFFISTLLVIDLLALFVEYFGINTGFGEISYIKTENEFYQPAKTFWDWLQLLIIPLALVVGVYFLNRSEKRLEIKLAKERAEIDRFTAEERNQERALGEYFDRMSELLLDYNLKDSEEESIHREVAKTRTLTVLRRLNGDRKGNVLKFLCDSGLANSKYGNDPIINLSMADLGGANLAGANLKEVNLSRVSLYEADLIAANLEEANLEEANLEGARLQGAKLQNANFDSAKLNMANLAGADLGGASLVGASLLAADLQGTEFHDADLRGTELLGVDLKWAYFQGADLQEANLTGANLDGVNFTDAKLDGTIFIASEYLNQLQLNKAFYIHTPPILPEGLKLPPKKKV